jgi:two-component system, chemotaxis family, protein-glutamate methylesterase/glutaminase
MADRTGVLVVDDSAFMRKVLKEVIDESAEFQVVDAARDGQEALDMLERYGREIQLVTLDIQMPKMDGLTCLQEIMQRHPRRVVMVSSLTTAGAKETLQALDMGAVDFIAKPGGAISVNFKAVGEQLIAALQAAARSRLPVPGKVVARHEVSKPAPRQVVQAGAAARKVVMVASSTGGPKALSEFLPLLPGNLGASIILVQHMPVTFTKLLAERLNRSCEITVKEADEGEPLTQNVCLVAPGGFHLELTRDERVKLTSDPPIGGLRPCADITMRTVATVLGARALGVVLTGMGRDGTEGCRAMKNRGSKVLVESKDTALIYGMPRSVAEAGLADREVPLNNMAQAVVEFLGRM